MNGTIFDKRQTNIAKGLAIIILLWHHLFYNENTFVSLLSFQGRSIEHIIAQSGKVCVAIFVLLSGYGLYQSYKLKYCRDLKLSSIKNDLFYVINHLKKLMIDYWIVYLLFVPLGFLFSRNPVTIYQGNIVNCLLDFFGLSNLFGTPTMNSTWWFMSLIIILYLIYPLLHRVMDYSAELLLVISFFLNVCYLFPNIANLRLYIFPFILGMYISKYNLLYKLSVVLNTLIKRILVCLVFILSLIWLKYLIFINSTEIDGFIAVGFILFAFLVISSIPFVNYAFMYYGKYSGLIFMFHTFVYEYYLKDFIYGFKYSLLIFFIMVILCYALALTITGLKKLLKSLFRLHRKPSHSNAE